MSEKSYLLFLDVRKGRLAFHDSIAGAVSANQSGIENLRHCCQDLDGADLSAFAREPLSIEYSVTSSGLSETSGTPRRFTDPDRGKPISVIADISTLPSGIASSQALGALQNALDAWEAESSILFELSGTQSFSKSANNYQSEDGLVVRIQMHDNFDEIPDGGSTLGFGGSGFFVKTGAGATVDGLAFNPSSYGYVILEHTKAALSDLMTLEEVLAHELGHVIGLAHSSETSDETDTELAEALMFFQAHKDNRGAVLNSYDILTVRKAHPADTPPFGLGGVIRAVTTSDGVVPSNPQVNQFIIPGSDSQGGALSYSLHFNSTNAGSFSISGDTLTYSPSDLLSAAEVNPNNSFYDRAEVSISDGVNRSPILDVYVTALQPDTSPSGQPDGIPDDWMIDFFGSSSGSTASVDSDGDGLSNLQEYRLGLDPTVAASRFRVINFAESSIEWTARQFDNYRVESSTDLISWTMEAQITHEAPSNSMTYSELPETTSAPKRFYRIVPLVFD